MKKNNITPYILLINCSPDDADIYFKHNYGENSFIIHDDIEYAPNVYFCDSSALGKAINDIISLVINDFSNNKHNIHVIATQDRRKYEHTAYKLKENNIGIIKLKIQRFTNDNWRRILVSKNSAYL